MPASRAGSAIRGLSDDQARRLAAQSKIILHIDGGMHSVEVAGHQLPLALAYELPSAKNDAEVDRILDGSGGRTH